MRTPHLLRRQASHVACGDQTTICVIPPEHNYECVGSMANSTLSGPCTDAHSRTSCCSHDGSCRNFVRHYRRAIAADPANALILRTVPCYAAIFEQYV